MSLEGDRQHNVRSMTSCPTRSIARDKYTYTILYMPVYEQVGVDDPGCLVGRTIMVVMAMVIIKNIMLVVLVMVI